jgi:hypothetical protein
MKMSSIYQQGQHLGNNINNNLNITAGVIPGEAANNNIRKDLINNPKARNNTHVTTSLS